MEKFAVQMIFNVKDSLRSKKSENFRIQRKSASNSCVFLKSKIFGIQRKFNSCGERCKSGIITTSKRKNITSAQLPLVAMGDCSHNIAKAYLPTCDRQKRHTGTIIVA